MPPSENKSVKSSRSSRSRRSSNSYHHTHDFAESSDEEERSPVRTEFSHRSRIQKLNSTRNPSPPGHVEYSSDREEEDDDEEASHNLTEEDSNLRISSLLMSSSNADGVKSTFASNNMSSHGGQSEGNQDIHDTSTNENGRDTSMKTKHGSSRNDIINSVESRAVRRADACTLKMGEIMDYLHKALDLAQSYDKLNVLQEMEQWKERAIRAEKMYDEMAQEIQNLKKEVITWENRTRRAEKRCERLQNGDLDIDLHYRNLYSHNNLESSNASDVATKPNVDLKALIQGKSFRNKWDKKRIAGIEEEIRQVSDGESTIAARDYINQFIESTPRPVPKEQETRDDALNQESKHRKVGNTTQSVRKLRSMRHQKTHQVPPQTLHQQHHHEEQVGHSLEMQENDNSWVEMLSI